MSQAISFAPVWNESSVVLVLGSSPGVASLRAQGYYAHPRNVFWPIMADLFEFDVELPYMQRLASLSAAGLALWDVVHQCERPGSLDANIRAHTVESNDIEGLVTHMPRLRLIAFNGGAASRLYHRHCEVAADLPTVTLPSTSPAHAAITLEQKREQWRQLLAYVV